LNAQDAVAMIRYQRELVEALETAREFNNLVARGFEENYEFKYLGPAPSGTTVEVGPHGLLRISFPVYPPFLWTEGQEKEPSEP
jgi:hypothetical protein